MYSCGVSKRESVVVLNKTAFKGFASAQYCRFDLRYDPMHQSLGCKGCKKDWDTEYLRKVGLLK
jgi:hypothetical protein